MAGSHTLSAAQLFISASQGELLFEISRNHPGEGVSLSGNVAKEPWEVVLPKATVDNKARGRKGYKEGNACSVPQEFVLLENPNHS